MEIQPEKLYTTKEVAAILSVSEPTAKRYLGNNILSSIKFGGSRRILGEALTNILSKNSAQRSKKMGCELSYPGKKDEWTIISETPPVILELKKRFGQSQSNRNKLIQGDNLSVLKTLYDDESIRGNIDLIYIDPPFGTNQDFVGHNDKSYSDRIINTEFLEFLRARLIFLRELLSESGSIYLHIDNKIGHYIKIILDEVFGDTNFRNDITRIKCNPKNFDRRAFGNIKDVIYFYSRNKKTEDSMFWADFRLPLSEEETIRQFPKIDKQGRRYATTPLHAKGETLNGPTGKTWKELNPPKGRHWRYAPSELTRLDNEGLIEWSSRGNPRKIIYADENRGKKIQDVWDFKDPGFESALYPTEKNLDLLKQIILSSSKKGDLILDCFAGSGTTLMAAHELDRDWIGIDANQQAVETITERFNSISNKKSVAFNLYST